MIFCLLVMAGILLPCAPGFADELTPGYLDVQQAFLREEFQQVAMLAEAFLSDHPAAPESARVGLWLALSLDRVQRTSEALKVLDRVKRHLNATSALWPEVLFWEGDMSRRVLETVRAKLAYQRLLEDDPQSTWAIQAQMGLGLVYLHQQAYELALGYFHEVALRRPTAAMAVQMMLLEGFCQLRLGRFNESYAILEPLSHRLSDPVMLAQATFYIGESLSGLGRFTEAVAAYQRTLQGPELSPWSGLARFGVGWAYYQQGRCEESLSAFNRYVSRGGIERNIDMLFAQGTCLMQRGREEDARAHFDQAMAINPAHPLAIESGLAIAECDIRRERWKPAEALLQQLLHQRLTPTIRARVQLRLGAIALQQGDAVAAQRCFQDVPDVDEPALRQAALNGLGDASLLLGDVAAARHRYEESTHLAQEATPAAYARYQLGRIQMQAGALEEAMAIFQRLAAHSDEAIANEARLALVLGYLREHEEELAKAQVESLRREHPHTSVAARAAYYQALFTLERNDTGGAEGLAQEAVDGAPRSDEALEARLLLIDLRSAEQSPQQAMAWVRQMAVAPSLPRLHRATLAKRLGELAQATGAYAEAIYWYDEAAGLSASLSGETGYRIASCYEEGGDLEIAIQWYDEIEEPSWRVRGQLAMAKLFEREERTSRAASIYAELAKEPIPEAKVAQERLAALRDAQRAKTKSAY